MLDANTLLDNSFTAKLVERVVTHDDWLGPGIVVPDGSIVDGLLTDVWVFFPNGTRDLEEMHDRYAEKVRHATR